MEEKKTLEEREREAEARLKHVEALEAEAKRREAELKAKENAKKQVPLRLSPTLWNEIARWAEEDFRSINGQIEYILTEAVRKRR